MASVRFSQLPLLFRRAPFALALACVSACALAASARLATAAEATPTGDAASKGCPPFFRRLLKARGAFTAPRAVVEDETSVAAETAGAEAARTAKATAEAWEARRKSFNRALSDRLERYATVEERRARIGELVHERQALKPDFPGDKFLAYLHEHPEKLKLDPPKASFARVLNDAFRKYDEQDGALRRLLLARTRKGVQDAIELPLKEKGLCAAQGCSPGQLRNLALRFSRALEHSCLANNRAALSNLGMSLAISWGADMVDGLQHHLALGDYPWEWVATSLLWSPVFAEVGCRNTFAHQLPGEKIAPANHSIGQKVKEAMKKNRAYLKWITLSAMSSTAFAAVADHLRGKGQSPEAYGSRFLFYATYANLVDPPKRVLVLDPIGLRLYPAMRAFVERLVRSRVIAPVIWVPTEAGARLVLSSIDTEIFFAADRAVKGYFDALAAKARSAGLPAAASRAPATALPQHLEQPDARMLKELAERWSLEDVGALAPEIRAVLPPAKR